MPISMNDSSYKFPSSQINYDYDTERAQKAIKQYGAKVSAEYGDISTEKTSMLWNGLTGTFSAIGSILPSTHKVGSALGGRVVQTYGAGWTNNIIDMAVSQYFKSLKKEQEPQSIMQAGWNLVKKPFFKSAEEIFKEAVKLTVTPKVMPVLAVLGANVGGASAVAVISAMGSLGAYLFTDDKYNAVTVANFLTYDPIKNIYASPRGVLKEEDVKYFFSGLAKSQLICELLAACEEIETKKVHEGKEPFAQSKFNEIVDNYLVTCTEAVVKKGKTTQVTSTYFPNGKVVTDKDREIIEAGKKALLIKNIGHNPKPELKAFIDLLADNSIFPYAQLSRIDRVPAGGKLEGASIPRLFDEDKEWMNNIVRAEDGRCFVAKGEKRGSFLTEKEMNQVFKEVIARKKELAAQTHNLPKENQMDHDALNHLITDFGSVDSFRNSPEMLSKMPKDEVVEYIKLYLIQRYNDGKHVFLNGEFAPLEVVNGINTRLAALDELDEKEKQEALEDIVQTLIPHLPEDNKLIDWFLINCEDGKCIGRDGVEVNVKVNPTFDEKKTQNPA